MFGANSFAGVIAAAVCFLMQAAVLAAEPAAPGATYDVDTAASRVFVKVGSGSMMGHEHGVEARLASGRLAFGAGGELTFDMVSFTADTPASRSRVGLKPEKESSDAKKVTQTMRGSEVLNVASFPTATFRMAAAKTLDGQAVGASGTYQLEGNLDLHGVQKKLQFRARLDRLEGQQQMRLTGAFTLKQSDYGIKPYSTLAGLVSVADELEITGDLHLDPAAR